jgi:GAF domain-containing protein
MTVQSTRGGAFDEADISVMRTVADQVAAAISNAHLFQQVQGSLEAERRAYGELTREAWSRLTKSRAGLAYRSHQGVVQTIYEDAEPEAADLPALDIPIRVRGQAIGTIQARKPDAGAEWAANESELVEALAEQLSTALEGARLYQDTQRRAAQERLVAEITARMRESLDIETVIKTAAEQVRQSFGAHKVVVQLAAKEATGQEAS